MLSLPCWNGHETVRLDTMHPLPRRHFCLQSRTISVRILPHWLRDRRQDRSTTVRYQKVLGRIRKHAIWLKLPGLQARYQQCRRWSVHPLLRRYLRSLLSLDLVHQLPRWLDRPEHWCRQVYELWLRYHVKRRSHRLRPRLDLPPSPPQASRQPLRTGLHCLPLARP